MQKLHRSSQPFMVVTSAITGALRTSRPSSDAPSGARGLHIKKRGAIVSNSVRAIRGPPPILPLTRAGRLEPARHAIGVVHVHLATEGLQEVAEVQGNLLGV